MAKTTQEKEEKSLKILKTVVISMGILLIVGTFALFIAVLQKSTSSEPKTVVYNNAPKEEVAKCIYKNVEIPTKAEIINATTQGDIITIVTKQITEPQAVNKVTEGNSLTLSAQKSKTSQKIIIYDLCTSTVLSKLDFVSE